MVVPQIIHFNRVFHYKPSILGYPYFWKHPYDAPDPVILLFNFPAQEPDYTKLMALRSSALRTNGVKLQQIVAQDVNSLALGPLGLSLLQFRRELNNCLVSVMTRVAQTRRTISKSLGQELKETMWVGMDQSISPRS